jgi:hypothetical protein
MLERSNCSSPAQQFPTAYPIYTVQRLTGSESKGVGHQLGGREDP